MSSRRYWSVTVMHDYNVRLSDIQYNICPLDHCCMTQFRPRSRSLADGRPLTPRFLWRTYKKVSKTRSDHLASGFRLKIKQKQGTFYQLGFIYFTVRWFNKEEADVCFHIAIFSIFIVKKKNNEIRPFQKIKSPKYFHEIRKLLDISIVKSLNVICKLLHQLSSNLKMRDFQLSSKSTNSPRFIKLSEQFTVFITPLI